MNKAMKVSSLLLAAALIAVVAMAATPSEWFDMEKCAMCKPIMEEPNLMQNMTWEHHNISNGIVTVSTVKPEFMAAFENACTKWDALGKKLAAGEKMDMCPMCMSLGGIFAKGAKEEFVKTMHGSIGLITSDKPEVVAEIQAWGQRTTDEMKKMEAAEAQMQHN